MIPPNQILAMMPSLGGKFEFKKKLNLCKKELFGLILPL